MAAPSLIGFATKTLHNPAGSAPSLIGFASKVLTPPHYPTAFWDGTEWQWSPVRMWNGTIFI